MSFWTRVHLAHRALAWSNSLLKKSFMSPPSAGSSSRFQGAAICPTGLGGPGPFPKGSRRPSFAGRLRARARAHQRVFITSFHAVTIRDMIVLAKLSDMFASAMAMVTSWASTEFGSATTLCSRSSLLFCERAHPVHRLEQGAARRSRRLVPPPRRPLRRPPRALEARDRKASATARRSSRRRPPASRPQCSAWRWCAQARRVGRPSSGVRAELSEPILRAIHYLPISRAFMNMALEPLAMVELAS